MELFKISDADWHKHMSALKLLQEQDGQIKTKPHWLLITDLEL